MSTVVQTAEEMLSDKSRFATLLFIASESIFFALLVAAYVFYTGASPDGPNARTVLDPVSTGMYTACLLASSITVWLAERSQRKAPRRAAMWLGATMLLGAVFLFGEMKEYSKLLHENVTVSRDLFGSTYYTLTGFHALHVTIGLILLGIAIRLCLRPRMKEEQHTAFTCISWYWHFVDVVWVVVFSTVYLWSTR